MRKKFQKNAILSRTEWTGLYCEIKMKKVNRNSLDEVQESSKAVDDILY